MSLPPLSPSSSFSERLACVQDWIRSAMEAYDLLTHVADKISIVAHSTGAPLAVYVASHAKKSHPISELVLSGPNIVHNTAGRLGFGRHVVGASGNSHVLVCADATPRNILLHPIWGDFCTWLSPRTIPKPWRKGRGGRTDTLNPHFHGKGWYSSSFPVYAVSWPSSGAPWFLMWKEWNHRAVGWILGPFYACKQWYR